VVEEHVPGGGALGRAQRERCEHGERRDACRGESTLNGSPTDEMAPYHWSAS
jgi:hypothetical protein